MGAGTAQVLTYSMPAGIAGDITRAQGSIVEPNVLAATNAPTAYGTPVKLDGSGLVRAWGEAGGEDATTLYGFLVRPYPINSASGANAAVGAGAVPAAGSPCDVMRRGYMTVKLAYGTAVRGAAVYIRKTAGNGLAVGAISDNSDSDHASNVVVATNATFMGAADANGLVEISFKM